MKIYGPGIWDEDPNKPIVWWHPVEPKLTAVIDILSIEFTIRCQEDIGHNVPDPSVFRVLPNHYLWQEVKIKIASRFDYADDILLVGLTFLNVVSFEYHEVECNETLTNREMMRLCNQRYDFKPLKQAGGHWKDHEYDARSYGAFGLWKCEDSPLDIVKLSNKDLAENGYKGSFSSFHLSANYYGSIDIVASDVEVENLGIWSE